MDCEDAPPSTGLVQCCDCGCSCCSLVNRPYSGTWLRSVKRKYHEFEGGTRFVVPGLNIPQVAKVEIANECVALREMVSSQQQTIRDLSVELDEERNASASAANEAMSMILRLQREKAEVVMEFRQFKRFAEEKMAHDGQECLALEDLLYKREQSIQSLTCEVQAYKHRMMSYGLTEAEAEGENSGMTRNNSVVSNLDAQNEIPTYDYPPLKCKLNENQISYEVNNDAVDVEKYAFGETPRSQDHLKDLENRINMLEQSPRQSQPDVDFFGTKNVLEKVIVGHSPRRYRHFRRFSTDSSSSVFATVKEMGSDVASDSPKCGSAKKMDSIQPNEFSNLKKVDNASEVGDDTSDRVYTVDSVYKGGSNGVTEQKACIRICEDYMTTPRESLNMGDVGDAEIKKLYMRLQALEADRESMRQALISMRTDKVQLVLLKEIAQQLCKENATATMLPVVRKTSAAGTPSFTTIFKWIVSFVLWRKKARRSRYMFGVSTNNAGLLMLLDKGPWVRHWRCLSSTQV